LERIVGTVTRSERSISDAAIEGRACLNELAGRVTRLERNLDRSVARAGLASWHHQPEEVKGLARMGVIEIRRGH
jgi:hypothetical protein